jgi:hypothetical protein
LQIDKSWGPVKAFKSLLRVVFVLKGGRVVDSNTSKKANCIDCLDAASSSAESTTVVGVLTRVINWIRRQVVKSTHRATRGESGFIYELIAIHTPGHRARKEVWKVEPKPGDDHL